MDSRARSTTSAAGRSCTNKELTGLLLEATGTGWERVEQVQDRLGHDLRYSVDISKIERELGYQPLVPFEQGLAETVTVVRRQPGLVGAVEGSGGVGLTSGLESVRRSTAW